ncbi:hypothetical protein [Lacticaseibacillus mingshuiensis]|uniref:hypothetical protein n=1 Tax=Lacticaseibacillus mingshuiensis TaxID=2799574 RepID=UPI0019512890|nr:hypothetical protein [Lacticaseibacillus mingshuiensis]
MKKKMIWGYIALSGILTALLTILAKSGGVADGTDGGYFTMFGWPLGWLTVHNGENSTSASLFTQLGQGSASANVLMLLIDWLILFAAVMLVRRLVLRIRKQKEVHA